MPRPRTVVTGGVPERYAKSPVKAAAFERVRNASIAFEKRVLQIEEEIARIRDAKLGSAKQDLVKAIERSLAEGLPKTGVALAYGVSYTRPIDELLEEYGVSASGEPRYGEIEPGTYSWAEHVQTFSVVIARGESQARVSFTSAFRRLVNEPGFGGSLESAWVYAGLTTEDTFFCVGLPVDEDESGVWFPTASQFSRFREELDYPECPYPYVFSASESFVEDV